LRESKGVHLACPVNWGEKHDKTDLGRPKIPYTERRRITKIEPGKKKNYLHQKGSRRTPKMHNPEYRKKKWGPSWKRKPVGEGGCREKKPSEKRVAQGKEERDSISREHIPQLGAGSECDGARVKGSAWPGGGQNIWEGTIAALLDDRASSGESYSGEPERGPLLRK